MFLVGLLRKLYFMKDDRIIDPLFRKAVEAIGAGDLLIVESILAVRPAVIGMRLDTPGEGYFSNPYLLWFVADNPVRFGKLPPNIVEIAGVLIRYVRAYAPETLQEQLDHAVGLVETGRVSRECGVQLPLLGLLIDNGAQPGNGQGALANGNIEAAEFLIERRGRITLAAAAGLDRVEDVRRMLPDASAHEKQVALVAAAFYGRVGMIKLLIAAGVDVDAFIDSGFHTHATALHQAVASGSLEAVKLLFQAGADASITDKVYHGTALDWAIYMQKEEEDPAAKERYKGIEQYLASR